MELKEGMYIRTKDGIIDKVIYDYDGHCASPNCDRKHVSCRFNYYNEDEIIKISEELGEVLEVGDFLDNHCIAKIMNRTFFLNDDWFISFDDVEDLVCSIATKEQFESIGYKI